MRRGADGEGRGREVTVLKRTSKLFKGTARRMSARETTPDKSVVIQAPVEKYAQMMWNFDTLAAYFTNHARCRDSRTQLIQFNATYAKCYAVPPPMPWQPHYTIYALTHNPAELSLSPHTSLLYSCLTQEQPQKAPGARTVKRGQSPSHSSPLPLYPRPLLLLPPSQAQGSHNQSRRTHGDND